MNQPVCKASLDSPAFGGAARAALLRCRRADGRVVIESDVARFTETLRLVGEISPTPQRVCDLATFGGMEPALVELFGVKEVVTTGSMDSPDGGELVFHDAGGREAHRFPHHRFDLEDRFPFADAAFDLVIFTEVLEHISRDPMHTMSEINRITRPGGWLLLTTPNCVSLRCVMNAVRGQHPYLWSPYSRGADRDRHNREYTPGEVACLLNAAGYKLESLHCRTVYGRSATLTGRFAKVVPGVLLAAVRAVYGGAKSGWNGELTFALGQKAGAVHERHPAFLYY